MYGLIGCRDMIEALLNHIPNMFAENKATESVFGAAMQAAYLAAKVGCCCCWWWCCCRCHCCCCCCCVVIAWWNTDLLFALWHVGHHLFSFPPLSIITEHFHDDIYISSYHIASNHITPHCITLSHTTYQHCKTRSCYHAIPSCRTLEDEWLHSTLGCLATGLVGSRSAMTQACLAHPKRKPSLLLRMLTTQSWRQAVHRFVVW